MKDSLEATSLENLAQQAQMKRSILRHYTGNRDDIIVALCERYRQKFTEQWRQTLDWLPQNNRIEALIGMLFDERNQTYVNQSIIAEAIYAQAKRLEKVRASQLDSMDESITILVNELTKVFPSSSEENCQLVARTIYSNYLNSESLLPLNMPEEIKKLRDASVLAIRVLEGA